MLARLIIKFWQSSLARAGFAIFFAMLIVGLLAYGSKSHRPPAQTEHRPPDPQQIAYVGAEQAVRKRLPTPETAKFSDYATDQETGAAEVGRGIWEAWGKVDYRSATGSQIHASWQVAWDRKTNRIIYQRIGSEETGNYADALHASGAFPVGPDAGD